MLPRYAALAGSAVKEVPWPSGPYPLAEVIAALSPATAAIALVSPNNPTGAVATRADLLGLAAAAPNAALLVDLAYAEFADEDLTEVALSLPHALVFRTLSKAWGLAGCRVGYVVGPARLLDWLRRAGGPYAVAAPSLALAAELLARGPETMVRTVAEVRREREALRATLERHGAEALPSQANFVFCRPRDAGWLSDGLAGLGIAVRGWPGDGRLGPHLRITCPADEAAYRRLEQAIAAVLAPEALLFDLDGVLADVSGSYRRAIVETAASFGIEIGSEDIAREKARGDANNDWILTQRLLAARGSVAPLELVTERFERLYLGDSERPGLDRQERLLCDGELLRRLAARLPLAIVTGRPRAQALAFLERAAVASCFSTLVCMEDAPLKPDPAPVRLALERLGVTRAWLVGDTVDDMRAARGAGVVPLGFVDPALEERRRGSAAASLTQSGAARVLDRLSTLEELLP
jgi:HAD superfamily hydrolase (TIGR01548 family)